MGRPLNLDKYKGWIIHRDPAKPTEINTVECETCGKNTKKAKTAKYRADHKEKCAANPSNISNKSTSIDVDEINIENESPNTSQLSEITPAKRRHVPGNIKNEMYAEVSDCLYLYLTSNNRNLRTEKFKFLMKACELLNNEFVFPSILDLEDTISKRALKKVEESLLKHQFLPYLLLWGKKYDSGVFLFSVLQSKLDLSYCYVHCRREDDYSKDVLTTFCLESFKNAKAHYNLQLHAVLCDLQSFDNCADDFFENKSGCAFIVTKSLSMLIDELNDGGLYVSNAEERSRLDNFARTVEKMKNYSVNETTLAQAIHELFLSIMDDNFTVKLNYVQILNNFLNPLALGCHFFNSIYKDEISLLENLPVFKFSKLKLSIFIKLMIEQKFWEEVGHYRLENGLYKPCFDMRDSLDAVGFWDMAASEGSKLHQVAKVFLQIPAMPKKINLDEIYNLQQQYPSGIGDEFKKTILLWLQSSS